MPATNSLEIRSDSLCAPTYLLAIIHVLRWHMFRECRCVGVQHLNTDELWLLMSAKVQTIGKTLLQFSRFMQEPRKIIRHSCQMTSPLKTSFAHMLAQLARRQCWVSIADWAGSQTNAKIQFRKKYDVNVIKVTQLDHQTWYQNYTYKNSCFYSQK